MGYNRLGIRKESARNVRLGKAELTPYTESLFQKRVHAAIRTFPAYAEKVRAFRGRLPVASDTIGPEELPVWTKEDQKALFASLQGPPIPGSFVHATGGSTGVPVRFYMTRESYEWRVAMSDRGYSWAGAEEGRRSFYVWGTPIHPPSAAEALKHRLHHWMQRREYFDSFLFDEERKVRCCEAINRYRPEALVGYAGNLVDLACFARDNPGVLQWRSRSIVTAAEGLAPGRRELLEEHLGDEVFMSYGSREFMLIGMECSRHAGYHLASDNLRVEVVDDAGRAVAPGTTGRIVVTDLRNEANPFVRYEIGDLGVPAERDAVCECGLPFPLLASVDGRVQETLYTADGARLTALFIPHLMKEFAWIDGYQLEQSHAGEVTVNLICGKDPDPAQWQPVADALQAKLGRDTRIVRQRVAALKKGPTGKTPIVAVTPDPSLVAGG